MHSQDIHFMWPDCTGKLLTSGSKTKKTRAFFTKRIVYDTSIHFSYRQLFIIKQNSPFYIDNLASFPIMQKLNHNLHGCPLTLNTIPDSDETM